MGNIDKVNAERDDFIRKTLQEDKVVSKPVLKTFENHIENTNIKVKKYTYTQKNISLILFFLLIISVGFNIYLSFTNKNLPKTSTTNIENTINSQSSKNQNKLIESEVEIVDNVENKVEETLSNTTSIENNTTNVENTTTNTESTVKNVTINPINTTVENTTISESTSNDSQEINLDKLEELLKLYSIGINRINYEEDTLESNTFLLIIAKKYFSSVPAKDIPSNQKGDFVFNVENTNKYLKELTGKDFNGSISSYSNYIGYTTSSNSYLYGKDSDNVTKEKYTCSDLKITNHKKDVYTATAKIQRQIDKEITIYEITVKFTINKDFTYEQFKILDLKAVNKSFSPDNTLHLVG